MTDHRKQFFTQQAQTFPHNDNICVISNIVLCQTYFKNAKLSLHLDACAAVGDMQTHAVEVIKGLGVEIIE